MSATTVLLTGASGYLGQRILDQLLRHAGVRVVALVRADTGARLQQRRDELLTDRDAARVEVVAADLTQPQALASLRGSDITHVIHTAAQTRFNLDANEADAVNREGSRHIFALARTLPALRALVYLSSVYSCGLREGDIEERVETTRPAFANHYERSKFEAEQLLAVEFGDLPWQIHRTATVVADDTSGAVTQINVLHNTAGLIHRGLISILPGAAQTPVYLVDADPVARHCVALALDGDSHRVRHLCYPAEANLTLQQLIDTLMACFSGDPQFVARRIRPPLLTDLDSFLGVADVLSRGFTGLLTRQAVESVRPFAAQLFSSKRFAVSLPEFSAPRGDDFARQLLTNTLTHLLRHQWRTPPSRAAS